MLAAILIALALVFALVASVLGDTFFLRLATEALIFAGLAISVDILLGFTGLLSLGQALYFGIGAYTSALVLKEVAPSFWAALGASLLVGTMAGIAGGLIAIRTRGVYFALITFGLAQVVGKAIYNTRELGASDGIIGIPVIKADFALATVDAGDPRSFFLLVLIVIVAIYAATAYLMDAPFGRTLRAIRANEHRVAFLGYDVRLHKTLAFVLAADIAALSGALYPMLRGFVSPELLFFHVSGDALIMVVVGGVGTLVGPILGSVVLTILRSVIGTFTEHHLIVIGIVFMASVIWMPKGLVGLVRWPLDAWLARESRR